MVGVMGIFGKYNLPRIQGARTPDRGDLSTVQGAHTAQTPPSDPVEPVLVKLSPGPIPDLLPELILGPLRQWEHINCQDC